MPGGFGRYNPELREIPRRCTGRPVHQNFSARSCADRGIHVLCKPSSRTQSSVQQVIYTHPCLCTNAFVYTHLCLYTYRTCLFVYTPHLIVCIHAPMSVYIPHLGVRIHTPMPVYTPHLVVCIHAPMSVYTPAYPTTTTIHTLLDCIAYMDCISASTQPHVFLTVGGCTHS